MADGFSLNIDDSLLKNLEKADKLVNQIADSSQKMSKTVIESFKNVNNNALKPFIENLNGIRKALDAKAKPVVFREINTQASQAVDKINSFISLMDKINNTGSNKTRNSAVTKINQELDDAKKRLVELQNLLNFYAKGEGKKAIGFVDTTNIQQEARALMNRIDLLEREKASIQANARLRMTIAQRQEAIDNAWYAMENKKRQETERLAKVHSDAAKRSSDSYRKSYEERYRAYQAMFDKIEGLENRNRSNQSIANKGTILYDSIYSQSGIKSIQNMRNAIMQMQDAQNQLNLKTSDGKKRYDELDAKIKQVQKDIEAATNSNNKFGESHSKLLNYAQQLRRSLALMFSVSQISGYINKLVSVRKEFELQQKSLQVLLQSKDEANKLWQQTVDLAVRSPFRVKELVTYTRQLAAYRIETNKLHDTTKRLADVSAGLGVDMQRLILAFGQVRAANFLRGTELRQFTEAGIPMLDELAKHFTELEGKAISAGDVFEMISKRMVLFEDVEAVFKKMTNEGGAFFQMQEEQSKTLAGMISNLYDTIDLMLNDIGKSYDSFLKNSVNFAKLFVENWRAIAEAIKGVLLALAGYKLYQLAVRQSIIDTAVAQGVLNNSNTKQLTQIQLLRVGWNNLTTSMKAAGTSMKSMLAFNLPLLAVTALVSGIWKLVSTWKEHEEQLNKISKEYDELRKKAEKINVNFKIATDENNFKEQKNKLNELITLANNDYNMKIKVDVDGMDAKAIQDKFNEISSNIFEANIFAEHFAKQMQQATEWVIEDDILEDFQDLGNKANELFNQLALNRERLVFNLIKQEDKLNESQKKALDLLRKPKQSDENEAKYLQRLSDGYRLLVENFNKYAKSYRDANSERERFESQSSLIKELDNLKELGINAADISKVLGEWSSAFQEAKNEFNSFVSTLNLDENLTDEQKELRLKTAIDKEASGKGWNDFVKNYIYRWTEETFKIKFKPEIVEEDPLKAWQETYNRLFSGMEGFREITKNTTKQKEIIDRLNGSIKETEDLINRINKAGGIKATSKGGAYEGIDLSQLNNDLLELKKQRDWLGGSDKNKNTGKDWMSEVVKGIKEAHQEYIKLNKTLDDSEAKQLALNKYSKSFAESAKNAGLKDISLGQFKFETEEGAIEALTFLKNKLPKSAKQARFKLEEAIGEIRGEVRIRTKAEDDKILIEQIEDMFSGYEMSIELQKLNIPPDLAKQLFNIDALTLPELKNKVVSMESKFVGTDMEEEYRKFLKKIDEMEDKQNIERLKKFVKFLAKTSDEIANVQKQGALDITYAQNLFLGGKIDAEKYSEIIKNVVNEVNKEISKINLEKFKESPEYIAAMGDMAGYTITELSKLSDKIRDLISENAKSMTPDEIKAYNDALNKINEQVNKIKSPFGKSWLSELREINSLEKELTKEKEKQLRLQQELQNKQASLDALNKKLAELQAQPQSAGRDIQIQGVLNDITQVQNGMSNVNGQLNTTAGNISSIGGKLEKVLGGMGSSVAAVDKIIKGISQSIEATIQIFNDFKSMMDSFGVETDKGAWQDISLAMETLGEVNQKATQGWEDLKSGNIAGAVANTVGVVTSLISGINKIHDAKYERRIQREAEFVESLQHAYEKLGKAIEDAYSIDTLEQSGKNAKANLQRQIQSYYKMIDAEEDKKDTDDDRIKEWKYQIEELKQQIEDLNKDLVSTATAGILDSVLSASQEFTNAWLEAFNETGEGLSGLETNFKETMLEMVKQQAAMLISQSYVEKWKKQLEQYINPDDLELSTDEAKRWVDAVSNSLPQLNDALTRYFEAMKQAGVDLSGGGQSELSGLQRGIQELTESTGQEIAAYLNSIRFFVAEQTTYLSQIASSFGNTDIENPMVGQLRIIASQTTAINELLNSLTSGGHSMGGRGFRVFIS